MSHNILYIGENKEFLQKLNEQSEVKLTHCTNSLSFNNYLESFSSVPQIDMVL